MGRSKRHVTKSIAASLVLMLYFGCGGAMSGTIPPGGGTPVFMSTQMTQFTSTYTQCTTKRTSVGGLRPLCALTSWVGTGGTGTGTCKIVGPRSSGCKCFEGQAHACDPSTGGPCSDGTDCGIKACLATSDTSADWYASCVPLE